MVLELTREMEQKSAFYKEMTVDQNGQLRIVKNSVSKVPIFATFSWLLNDFLQLHPLKTKF